MSLKQDELRALGFTLLPGIDPEYFEHRQRVGFLLLINEKHKLYYNLFTINAHSCLKSAARLIKGDYADRARDLRDALRKSELEDWDVFFFALGQLEQRDSVKELLSGYQSLNTQKSRIDREEATWGYHVRFKDADRLFAIYGNKPMTHEEAIASFLRKWRTSLDAAINRRSVDLPTYYKGCTQLATATKCWMADDKDSFSIVEITALSGKTRKEVVGHANRENIIRTVAYRRGLQQ